MVVAFYLVDPDIQPLVSTSQYHPNKGLDQNCHRGILDVRLPVELIDKILDDVEGLMSEPEAEAFRRKKMLEERRNFGAE